MNKIISPVVLILFMIFSSLAFAQNNGEEDYIQDNPIDKEREERELVKKEVKKENLVFLDLFLFHDEITVSKERFLSGNIGSGSSSVPWVEAIRYDGSLSYARLSQYTTTGIYSLEGGILEKLDDSNRMNRRVKIGFEDSTYNILLGINGFFEQESFYQGLDDPVFNSMKFNQKGYGGSLWTGLRIGGFNDDFLAFRIGKGRLWSSGEMLFGSPYIEDLESLPIYEESFDYRFMSTEGRLRWRYLSLGVNTEYGTYDRIFNSPDIARFGYNMYKELTVSSNIELNPFPFQDIFSVVVTRSINLMNNDDLMIRNKPEYLRVMIRLRLD
jgi:hypothetical protein